MTRGPIVITGSGGFVGRSLVARLGTAYHALHFARDDWRERLDAVPFAGACVFHLAARVHSGERDEAAFQRDNLGKTLALAEAACQGGARRMVFLSSVKALGDETGEKPYTPRDTARPVDAYGRSKLAAEEAIRDVARARGLEFAIVRAPLVLGPGAKGNLTPLLRACDSPWPLPFGAVNNRRSFVHVDDLAALLVLCADDPRAAGRTYLAAHPHSFSTRELVTLVRDALGRPVRLFAVPPAWLEAGARAIGGRAAIRRLTRCLEVDSSAAEQELGWRAQIPLQEAAGQMVAAYRAGPRA